MVLVVVVVVVVVGGGGKGCLTVPLWNTLPVTKVGGL